jgi:hypothetical protein
MPNANNAIRRGDADKGSVLLQSPLVPALVLLALAGCVCVLTCIAVWWRQWRGLRGLRQPLQPRVDGHAFGSDTDSLTMYGRDAERFRFAGTWGPPERQIENRQDAGVHT